jgi:hypothetical protein
MSTAWFTRLFVVILRFLSCRYLKNTHGSTHSNYTLDVLDVFTIDKTQPFKSEIGNRTLLWHGSRLTNWVGIFSQGLRIAPPEAPCTGYMFVMFVLELRVTRQVR